MNLAPDHRSFIDHVVEQAHAEHDLSRDISARIVDEIQDVQGFGQEWTEAFLRELAIKGAAQLAREWRRRQTTVTTTAQGTTVPLPVYAAVHTAEGYKQVRLADMTAPQLRAHRERLSAQRNTLSKEVQYVTDLLDIMEADPSVTTAGQAERVKREQAA